VVKGIEMFQGVNVRGAAAIHTEEM
jgi:hypothetical protein